MASDNSAPSNNALWSELRRKLSDDSTRALRVLFEARWLQVKGSRWEHHDEHPEAACLCALKAEVDHHAWNPHQPVAEWDMATVCAALSAKSLVYKDFVREKDSRRYFKTRMCRRFPNCPHGDKCVFAHDQCEMIAPENFVMFKTSPCKAYPDCTKGTQCAYAHGDTELAYYRHAGGSSLSRFKVLVECGMLSIRDLQTRQGPCFLGCSSNVDQAVQSLRMIRNMVFHFKGTIKGISSATSLCLTDVVSRSIACVQRAALYVDHDQDESPGYSALKIKRGVARVHKGVRVKEASVETMFPVSDSNIYNAPSVPCRLPIFQSLFNRNTATPMSTWSVDTVVEFFHECKFPVRGIAENCMDGASLLLIYLSADAEKIITDPYPEGLGMSSLMFKGRFRCEMQKRAAVDAQ